MKSLQICMLLKNLIKKIPKNKRNIVVSGLSTNSKNIKRNYSEYFRKIKNIPIDIYLKIFYDSGIIWKYESNQNMFLNNTYIYSFGLGLDIVTLKNLSFTTEVSRNSQKETNLSFKLGADF